MWFKQMHLFQLKETLTFSKEEIEARIEGLSFRPCLPTMPVSFGWIPTVDNDLSPLVKNINGYIILCLQVEEKILPASVIRLALTEKIKFIESNENRKVYQKEKLALKDEIIITLLPRAFSRLTKIIGYIDPTHQWLVLNTTNAKKVEQFISLFKKTLTEKVQAFDIKKISAMLNYWLKDCRCPSPFNIEKSCLLKDPDQKNRMVRCQEQNLFAESIQALLQDGYKVKSLGLTWHDRIRFTLTDELLIQSIKFEESILEQSSGLEPDTQEQNFNTDFLIMSATVSHFLIDLMQICFPESIIPINTPLAEAV